jgi:hypothetical protein
VNLILGFIIEEKRMSLMVARRGPPRNYEREELVAYIHGIDAEGELAHILVHKRGSNVRFPGKLGAHKVAPLNSSDLDKWVREAEAVWELDETIGIPRSWMNIPETLEKIEMLNIKAAEKRKNLEALQALLPAQCLQSYTQKLVTA